MLLTPATVLQRGFEAYSGLHNNPVDCTEANVKIFVEHYGADPTVLSYVWYDLVTSSVVDTGLTSADVNPVGFKRFLMANHFAWAYPRNRRLLAEAFNLKIRQVEGNNLWRWLKAIASLKATLFNDEVKLGIAAPQHDFMG